ncbi:lytic transglycosylase domain-containing protein [Neorhizobium sp. T7_12]|uniref:lytic transglycosylase domain-containing protein n=1 Tax=Neorhizobium sp. T7_12 TaxID=2093832 RepID=UPI000CF85408|nr:lytic transglycosylase domain-containing protein [Neorhizobium sp. T7_12]
MSSHILTLIVAASFAAILNAKGHAQSGQPFDYARVSNDVGTPAMKPFDRARSQSEPRVDIYNLGASGNLSKEGHDSGANKIRHLPYPNGADISAQGSALTIGINANKYSNSSYLPNCPASPLPPDQIADLVEAAADRHGVDAGFATAIAWAESRFDQVRNSPRGARGPMQLMPATAKRLGVTDVCDPASNIDGGVRYLRLLVDQFRNPLLAAAAYNAGEHAIFENNGVPPYPETVRYVTAVLNRQLGLDEPGKTPGRGTDKHPSSVNPSPPPGNRKSGIIGARAVSFVGGVMKF